MESKNEMTLYHTMSYESSSERKLGKPQKAESNGVRGETKSLSAFTPTRRQSGLGRCRGISYQPPGEHTPSVHRRSYDFRLISAEESLSEGRKKLISTPEILHVETELSPALKPLFSQSTQALLEEEKETKQREPNDVTKSTNGETPQKGYATSRTSDSTFAGLASAHGLAKHHPHKFRQSESLLRENKSPNPLLQSNLKNLDFLNLIPASPEPGDPFYHFYVRRSGASAEAYKDFLYNLFGSITVIKQIEPEVKDRVPDVTFNLSWPKHVTSIFGE